MRIQKVQLKMFVHHKQQTKIASVWQLCNVGPTRQCRERESLHVYVIFSSAVHPAEIMELGFPGFPLEQESPLTLLWAMLHKLFVTACVCVCPSWLWQELWESLQAFYSHTCTYTHFSTHPSPEEGNLSAFMMQLPGFRLVHALSVNLECEHVRKMYK